MNGSLNIFLDWSF